MTAKREKRYVGAGSTTYLEFNLDPDIYKAGVATALGVNAAAPTGSGVEIVPYTLKLARRSTSVVIIRMKMERDVAGETESRRIDLVCDKNNADTAKAALNNLTVNIGPANSAWTLKAQQVMDFSNPSLWQLVYLQSFAGDYFGTLQLPIPPFETPALTESAIRVKISTVPARPSWSWAGNMSQVIDAGNVQGVIQKYSLDLSEDRVLILEPFSPYILRFGLAKWLPQATISIFGYTG